MDATVGTTLIGDWLGLWFEEIAVNEEKELLR
jgi:hypothetical protein